MTIVESEQEPGGDAGFFYYQVIMKGAIMN